LRLAQLAPLAACSFVVATDGTLMVGLLGRIGRAVSASPAATGQGITVFAVAYALGSPVVVAATRHWSAKRLLLVGVLAFAAANAATAAAAALATLFVVRAMAGLAAGLVTPMAASIASASSREGERGRALAVVVSGASAAALIGVPIGTAAGVYLGWRVPFFAVAALGLILVAVLARQDLPGDSEASLRSRLRGRGTAIGLTLSVTLLWSAGSFTFFSYLTLVLRTAGAVGGAGVAAELMLFGAAGVFGAYLAGRLTDRWGGAPVAAAALITMTLSEVGFALLAASTLSRTALAVLASLLFGVYAVATWAVTPAQQHRLVGLAPQATRMLLSLNATALYAGVAIGSAAGGVVLATTHSVVALCLVSAAFGLASALTLSTSTDARSIRLSWQPSSGAVRDRGH
jgi:predicted MFS family arabinose efflux permease